MFRRRRRLTLNAWRVRLIRETESALLAGLLHPERAPRIPTVEVGTAIFDARWAHLWWNKVLELDVEKSTRITMDNPLPTHRIWPT